MANIPKGFSTRLRELRSAAGLSQSDLAARAGMNLWGLAKLEYAQREPKWYTVVALARALGVTPDAFLATGEMERGPEAAEAKGKSKGRRRKGGA